MANTVISLTTDIELVDKYKQLMEASADGDSLYIRAREVVKALKEDNLLTNGEEGSVIAQVVAQLSGSLSGQAMGTALQWAAKEKDLTLQKEELEYKIDLMKLEADKATQDVIASEANKHLLQARLIREYGNKTIDTDGDIVALDDSGKVYEEIRALQQDTVNKALLPDQIQSQTEEVQARTHKLVADTFVNHGLFTGYTITNNGIASATQVATGYVTLSELQKQVAKEQAKGYAWNAWSNAASSSSGMIGTLVAAEIPELVDDTAAALSTWSAVVGKLQLVEPPQISI